jgi:hypothetical protein
MLSNLDREKIPVTVFVFDHEGNYVTAYIEHIHDRTYELDDENRHEKMKRELVAKLKSATWHRDENVLVATDGPAPVLVRHKLSKPQRVRELLNKLEAHGLYETYALDKNELEKTDPDVFAWAKANGCLAEVMLEWTSEVGAAIDGDPNTPQLLRDALREAVRGLGYQKDKTNA